MCYVRSEKCVAHRGSIRDVIMLCDTVRNRYTAMYSAEGMGTHVIPYTDDNVKRVQYLLKHDFDYVDRYSSLCKGCFMRTYGNPAESAYVNYRTNMDAWMLPKKMT